MTGFHWTGLAVICLVTLMVGTGQAAEPANTLPGNGQLRVGVRVVALYGISLPAPGQLCEDTDVLWPCGTIAWQALDQHLLNKKLDCIYMPPLDSSEDATLTVECWIGKQNLNRWLIESGWALTVGDTESIYYADELRAQQNNLGLWRGSFIPPDSWRPTLIGENTACSVCTARHKNIVRTRGKKRKLDEATSP